MLLIYFGNYAVQILNIACGYKAKILASSVFISKRVPDIVLSEELFDPKLRIVRTQIDYQRKVVTASAIFGLIKREARFRSGLGVTLDLDGKANDIDFDSSKYESTPYYSDSLEWPLGEIVYFESLPKNVNSKTLNEALDWAFLEPDSLHLRRTRAMVIVFNGRIIAEKYAIGFSKDTALLGWSMTKSVTNALVGIRVGQGKLNLDEPASIPEWQSSNDPRKEITLNHLMHMSSGLKFGEHYSSLFSDVVVMLYRERDTAEFALKKQLIIAPGSRWAYSSGATNIISKILRDTFNGDENAYLEFPRKELFDRIGMTSAVIEPDASGTFVGSSYMYATARDWARFGLLYLNDGVWNGARILPDGWVKYSITPAAQAPNGKYGALIWLGAATLPVYNEQLAAKLPTDLYFMWGHESQFVTIISSLKLVVVRLGLTKREQDWDQAGFIGKIAAAIQQ